ncbi:MAG: hypothetical protein QM662_05315, partial [Gordonia sp. (in: high G+C Gram-positive bacteria)]
LGVAVATAGVHDLDNYLPEKVIDVLALLSLDDDVEDLLPEDVVFCFGGLAVANSSTAGSCANIAGTLDFRYNKPDGRVELALTNPLTLITMLGDQDAMITYLTEQAGDVLLGNPIYLTKDIARLTFNGTSELLALTSDYGYAADAAPITIGWLGSTLVIFPGTFNGHADDEEYVNYLSSPEFTFGTPTGLTDLIPTLNVSPFNVFDLFDIPGIDTTDLTSGLSTATSAASSYAVTLPSEEATGAAQRLSAAETEASTTASTLTESATESVVEETAESVPAAETTTSADVGGSAVATETADDAADSGSEATSASDGQDTADATGTDSTDTTSTDTDNSTDAADAAAGETPAA